MSRDSGHFATAISTAFEGTVVVRQRLEEQYHDLEHQTETAKLGMWLFLATEIMMFGTLFMALGVYRMLYAVPFEKASEQLNWQVATANTFVLIASSLTMVLAVHYCRLGNQRLPSVLLIATMVLGVAFLVLKGYEYYTDYEEFLIPGWRFHPQEWIDRHGLRPDQVPHVKLFLLFYWIMTALHAVHMVIGIALVGSLLVLARRGHFSAEYYSPVDIVGLYWHFVDIVWIFLLPMLYLLGTHTWNG